MSDRPQRPPRPSMYAHLCVGFLFAVLISLLVLLSLIDQKGRKGTTPVAGVSESGIQVNNGDSQRITPPSTAHETSKPEVSDSNKEHLLELCRNSSGATPLDRLASFHALVEMGSNALACSAALIQDVNVSSTDRRAVCRFLAKRCGRAGTMAAKLRDESTMLLPVSPIDPTPEVIEALNGALLEHDLGLREHAAFALGSMGEFARPTVPRLAQLLETNQAGRTSILLALEELGPVAVAATPQLVSMLAIEPKSDDLLDQITAPEAGARGALLKIGELAIPELAAQLTAPKTSQKHRLRISMVLAKNDAGLRSLASIFRSAAEPEVRSVALIGLGFGRDRAISVLDELLGQVQAERRARREIAALLVGMASEPAKQLFAKHNLAEVISDDTSTSTERLP